VGWKDVSALHRKRMGSNKYRLATLSIRFSFKLCVCGVRVTDHVRGNVRRMAIAVNECVYSRNCKSTN
jgi:hypothetical protein